MDNRYDYRSQRIGLYGLSSGIGQKHRMEDCDEGCGIPIPHNAGCTKGLQTVPGHCKGKPWKSNFSGICDKIIESRIPFCLILQKLFLL